MKTFISRRNTQMKTSINRVDITAEEGAGGYEIKLSREGDHMCITIDSEIFTCSPDEWDQLIQAMIAFKGDDCNLGG